MCWARKAQKVFEELHEGFFVLAVDRLSITAFLPPIVLPGGQKGAEKSRWPNRAGKKFLLGYLFPIDKPISSFPYFFSYMFEQTANRKGRKFVSFIQDGPCAETFQFQKV